MLKKIMILSLVLIFAFTLAPNALAQEDDEIEVTGEVTSVVDCNEVLEEYTYVIETDEGDTYTVVDEEEFVCSLSEGDVVEVEGTLEDDGTTIIATKSKLEEIDEDEEDGDEEDNGGGYFCRNREEENIRHPVAGRIADRYEEDYEADYVEIMGWFCDEDYGLGEIMLAFVTCEALDEALGEDPGTCDVDSILHEKTPENGWGKVWQAHNLIGKPAHAGPPFGHGPPSDDGPPFGHGPPSDDGPPFGKGPKSGDGPPFGNGPHSGDGPPFGRGPNKP